MGNDKKEEETVLETAFIAGFRGAADKQAFLRLARVPFTLRAEDGSGLKLVDVKIGDRIRVGSASPGFGTRELAYQPLPAALVRQETSLSFVYVSAEEVVEKTLAELMTLSERPSLKRKKGVGSEAARCFGENLPAASAFLDH